MLSKRKPQKYYGNTYIILLKESFCRIKKVNQMLKKYVPTLLMLYNLINLNLSQLNSQSVALIYYWVFSHFYLVIYGGMLYAECVYF